VGNLQSIKREAEALLVPECFIGPKEKMVEGMAKINDGFMQFMADANLGKLLAKVRFEEGAKLISEYEQTARACSPENG
jgi:hypothetical protein